MLALFEPLGAFLATRPAFVPDDIMLTADRTFVPAALMVLLLHNQYFNLG
jgi:hypothetical protein